MGKKLTQARQVAVALEQLGGCATLAQLYDLIDFSSGWGGDSPQASVRRALQKSRNVFRIRPGLWALTKYAGKFKETQKKKDINKIHYYYQGLLLEIGNAEDYKTFAPNQDKNRPFLNSTLGETRTLDVIHSFGYEQIVRRTARIDALWFNRRHMPEQAFEVETTTDFTGALSRYIALQDFNVKFHIIADKSRKKEYENKMEWDEYYPIRERVTFMNTEDLADWHATTMERAKFKL